MVQLFRISYIMKYNKNKVDQEKKKKKSEKKVALHFFTEE